MKTLGFIGCGSLACMIADGVLDKLSGEYRILTVTDAVPEAAQALSKRCGAVCADSVDALLEQKPDIVIEAAAPAVLKLFGKNVLESGCDLMPLSVGALADEAFFVALRDTAAACGRRVFLVSGAIGGLDLMRAAMFAGSVDALIETRKPPHSLEGAPGLTGATLSREKEELVFSGSAREAIAAFPKNVNVAVALGVCTCGVDKTRVRIVSDPAMTRNRHTLFLSGDFGEAKVEISALPSPKNPKSSALAAMSVLARLESLASPLSFI